MKTGESSLKAVAVLALVVAVAGSPAGAAQIEKKFRVSLQIGGTNPLDEIQSDAGNRLILVDSDFALTHIFTDPRDDSSVFGSLEMKAATGAQAAVQYGLSKIFLVEFSVGYLKSDVGDVEVQAQFDRIPIDPLINNFNFTTFRIPAGEVERIPVQLTALARFRPRATFNPYVGLGLGYSFIGFEPTDEFNQLSVNLDASRGALTRVGNGLFGDPTLSRPPQSEVEDLTGARVDARDTWEWSFVAGTEMSFKKNWVVFADVRYVQSSRSLSIGFNGSDFLGVPVPQLNDFSETSVFTETTFGPFFISQGGLVDGGSLQPSPLTPTADCSTDPEDCFFDITAPDGRLDLGFYYAQGGEVDYDFVSFQLGVRYTF